MKMIFLFLPLLILLAGCDAPQRTRAPSTWLNAQNYENKNNTDVPTGNLNGGGNGGVTNPPISTTPGFENCDLSQKYHTIDIGYFGVCQSTQDEKQIMFNPSLTSQSVRTCLIPTYKESNGSSTYIGQPQCTYTTSNQVVSGQLYKDRPGFSNYPLNGMIVMKEPLLPEYINCMQGYVNWPRNMCPNGPTDQNCASAISSCPYGGRTNASCDSGARSYMATICNAFKSKYSNSYIDIRLK